MDLAQGLALAALVVFAVVADLRGEDGRTRLRPMLLCLALLVALFGAPVLVASGFLLVTLIWYPLVTGLLGFIAGWRLSIVAGLSLVLSAVLVSAAVLGWTARHVNQLEGKPLETYNFGSSLLEAPWVIAALVGAVVWGVSRGVRWMVSHRELPTERGTRLCPTCGRTAWGDAMGCAYCKTDFEEPPARR